jgi:16S rRNA (adenine1518-N6/adenine1519-N6)-dimethyltransferase
MTKVKAKKHLGQHFLKDKNIALKIVEGLSPDLKHVLEIGPGMGILTQFLAEKDYPLSVVEIDNESVAYLKRNFENLNIVEGDFLKLNLHDFGENIGIIGNFPYNISTQILFKIFETRDTVTEMVGMFQKEVADRVISTPGSKVYGILSVLIQAFYNTKKLLIVEPGAFHPPPKVRSMVIKLSRNNTKHLDCNENLFVKVVKATFNQRRKTIRNSIKNIINSNDLQSEFLAKRPEQLSVNDFIQLTKDIENIE